METPASVPIELRVKRVADKAHRAYAALDRLRRAVETAGLVVLSTSWDTWKSSYSFRCREGHQFDRTATFAIYHENACPTCRQ